MSSFCMGGQRIMRCGLRVAGYKTSVVGKPRRYRYFGSRRYHKFWLLIGGSCSCTTENFGTFGCSGEQPSSFVPERPKI